MHGCFLASGLGRGDIFVHLKRPRLPWLQPVFLIPVAAHASLYFRCQLSFQPCNQATHGRSRERFVILQIVLPRPRLRGSVRCRGEEPGTNCSGNAGRFLVSSHNGDVFKKCILEVGFVIQRCMRWSCECLGIQCDKLGEQGCPCPRHMLGGPSPRPCALDRAVPARSFM